MEQAFSEAFYLTGATILGLGLVLIGALIITLCTDVRTYYQIRGIFHREEWNYTIDKIIKAGKPDDNISPEEGYIEVWFREKDKAEDYLMTLQQKTEA